MTSRERDFSTAVAAATKTTEIRRSKFRRAAGDFEELQIPRRFGFGKSPSPRHSSRSATNYERASPPRNSHCDTPRQDPSPPGRRMASNDVRAVQNTVAVEDGQPSVFSQLALVLGFDLAKQVTQRHPHVLDLNRLANLALDITVLALAAAAYSAPRSASTTSQTSTQKSQQGRRSGRSFNRSSTEGTRRFGRGNGRGRAFRSLTFARSRANSNPVAADDAFLTAVSAATAAAAAAPSPPRTPVVDDDADIRTDATADDDDVDLIDWEGEANEVLHSASAPLVVESTHLLD